MNDDLSLLKKQVEDCRKCKLWKSRNKPVFGEGPDNAKIMLIGLGPGYHENLEGRPFVGAAGKLLTELLTLAGLQREDVYITNIIKCYLPNNRPTKKQIKVCTFYLNEQMELIKPTIIMPLGNIANRYIFNKFQLLLAPIGKLHGKILSISTLLSQATIIPMYHPAAALRNPRLKDIIKIDWKQMARTLNNE
jgi:DNA polymerase